MKILHTVELYHPSVGGAQEVVRRISEGLVARGHEVTVATTRLPDRAGREHNGVRIEEFDVSGNAVRGIRGDAQAYRRFLFDGRFDVMMNYAAQQWATDLVLPIVDELAYPAVLAPCGFSGLYEPAYAHYFDELPAALRNYARLVFHSAVYRDIEFARRHGLTHLTVIPNGASVEEFGARGDDFRRRRGIGRDETLLLTVGSHTGLKGHRTTIEAFRRARIGPATLVVIGNRIGGAGCFPDCRRRAWRTRLTSFGRKRVLLLDVPRPEVVECYQAADLFVFPSNIECSPVVLFEAMASRTPFLTTACGNAEEITTLSGGGVVLPTRRDETGTVWCTDEDLAHAIEGLVRDPQHRRALGEAGHRAWADRFTWEGIVARYEALYRELHVGAGSAHA